MRILVTGVAGFMGSHIADHLIKLDYDVYGIDNLKSGSMENVPKKMLDEKKFSVGDLSISKVVDVCFKWMKPDVVHHLACYSYEGLSQFSPVKVANSVYMASLNIFVNSVNHNVKRVVYYSSMARYGRGKVPFDEEQPRNPCDVYGASKVASEVALEAIAEATGLEYNILVPHNVCGKRMRLNDVFRGVLAIWINCLMKGKPFYIYGDGSSARAFSHIDDIIEPCIKAGFDEDIKKEVINIGSGRVHTLNEVANILLDEFGSGEYKYTEDRPCEVREAFCTIEKSQKLLGFEDRKDIRDILRDIISYAKEKGPKEFSYDFGYEIEKGLPKVWKERLV